MRKPEAFRKDLKKKWSSQRRDWLLGKGDWPLLLRIKQPTGPDILKNGPGFDDWLKAWRQATPSTCGEVKWGQFDLRSVGTQELPYAWCFDTPETIARELGELGRWQRATRRFDNLAMWLPDASAEEDPAALRKIALWRRALSRHFDVLADWDDAEFELLTRVVEWIWRHPQTGMYVRELPINGIDSKWIETRRRILTAWLWALQGGNRSHHFYTVAGLRVAPDRLRMRVLDPALRAELNGLSDIEAPVDDFVGLKLSAKKIVIVENLFTGLAFEDIPGTIVFMRRGYAVDALARLPWLNGLPVFYWGDIDTHGLAMLSRLRTYLPHARSIMMDAETLSAFQSLCVKEPSQCTIETLPHLTDAEQRLYRVLRGHEAWCDGEGPARFAFTGLRLEQERIAWAWARQRVKAVVG